MVDLLTLDKFGHRGWSNMTAGERLEALQEVEYACAAEQGRPPVKVVAEPIDGAFGGWDASENKIIINEDLLERGCFSYEDRPRADITIQMFDTIAHEGYHAYQSYALTHPEVHTDKAQLEEWALNEGRYYGPGEDNRYSLQPQERDAWRHAYESTTDAFDIIEARNGMEPGREDYREFMELNSYDKALERERQRNPEVLEDMHREMRSACENRDIRYQFTEEEGESEGESSEVQSATQAATMGALTQLRPGGGERQEELDRLRELREMLESYPGYEPESARHTMSELADYREDGAGDQEREDAEEREQGRSYSR